MPVEWPADLTKLPIQRQLLLSTVRLEVIKPSGTHVGTGVFAALEIAPGTFVHAILTNKHVLQRGTRITGRFRRRTDAAFILDEGVVVELSPSTCTFIEHPDPSVDLNAIVTPALDTTTLSDGTRPGAIPISESLFDQVEANKLQIGEEITMVGYPVGLFDQAHNLPISRRGHLATTYEVEFGGKPEFVVDIGAIKGSSGSPIFLLNVGSFLKDGALQAGIRIMWLGLLWGGQVLRGGSASPATPAPTAVDELESADSVPLNLAHCIKTSAIIAAKPRILEVLRQSGKVA